MDRKHAGDVRPSIITGTDLLASFNTTCRSVVALETDTSQRSQGKPNRKAGIEVGPDDQNRGVPIHPKPTAQGAQLSLVPSQGSILVSGDSGPIEFICNEV